LSAVLLLSFVIINHIVIIICCREIGLWTANGN